MVKMTTEVCSRKQNSKMWWIKNVQIPHSHSLTHQEDQKSQSYTGSVFFRIKRCTTTEKIRTSSKTEGKRKDYTFEVTAFIYILETNSSFIRDGAALKVTQSSCSFGFKIYKRTFPKTQRVWIQNKTSSAAKQIFKINVKKCVECSKILSVK